MSEKKEINIGDELFFEIKGVSKEKILKDLEGQEITQVEELEDGVYEVGVKFFTFGENRLKIGKKEILVEVKSSLTDEKTIYSKIDEKGSNLKVAPLKDNIVLGTGVVVLAFIIFLLLKSKKKKRKLEKKLSPKRKLLKAIDEKDYENLSIYLREFINEKGESEEILYGDYSHSKYKELLELIDRIRFSRGGTELEREIPKIKKLVKDLERGKESV